MGKPMVRDSQSAVRPPEAFPAKAHADFIREEPRFYPRSNRIRKIQCAQLASERSSRVWKAKWPIRRPRTRKAASVADTSNRSSLHWIT